VIQATGVSGSAVAWGEWFEGPPTGATPTLKTFANSGLVTYDTNAAEAVGVQETATLVGGQSFNLQALVVRTIY
jgi:hypothetical protein